MVPPPRYQPLADFLAAQPPDVQQVTLTLDEVEAILGVPLSMSARLPSWWQVQHPGPHARTWRRVGWQVARPPSLGFGPRVTFERVLM
jgi:hypothetical protein